MTGSKGRFKDDKKRNNKLTRSNPHGKVFVVGDNIDTDAILPGKYLTVMDKDFLATHLFENYPEIAKNLRSGTIIVAGKNFGCGSSREGAPLALLGRGINVIVADSYARIFYRNCVNLGLLPIECPGISSRVRAGDEMEIDVGTMTALLYKKGERISFKPIPRHIEMIINDGGLINYTKKKMKNG